MKMFGAIVIFFGLTSALLAPTPVPEIDPYSTVSGLTLLAGAVLIFRSKRR
jgi:LPXTG-motif cell wall-anchored protein